MHNDLDKVNFFPLKLDSTIIITVITAYIYFCAFIYEFAYSSEFGIPHNLISVDISVLLNVWTTLITVSALIFFLFWQSDRLENKIQQKHPQFKNVLTYNSTLIFITGSIYIFNPIFKYEFLIFTSLFTLLNLYLLIKKIKKSVVKKSKKMPELIEVEKPSFAELQKQVNGTYLRLAGTIACICLIFSSSLGTLNAINEESFYVVANKPDIIVIRHYGDKFICREYDSKTKRLSKKIILMAFDGSNPLQLELKKLGRLNSQ